MIITRECVIICLFIFIDYISSVVGGIHQRRLLKQLLVDKQYDPLERPVKNDSQSLPVAMNLALQQIIEFVCQTWHDYKLTWKPEDYGNVDTVRIPSTLIWTPDIMLYTSADEKFDTTMKVNAVVQHTGDILYVPPGVFKSICPFNIASFPFDTQNCALKFGSWTHDDSSMLYFYEHDVLEKKEFRCAKLLNNITRFHQVIVRLFLVINLTAAGNRGQLDAYITNAEWELQEFSVVNSALKYECCPTLYPFVLFTLRIRRRSLYYVTNVVLPCFLISCMTLLGFILAPDSGEKLTLQITILLSVVTFSLLISDLMPPSSVAVPLISLYFLCVMCMSAISVTASVFVISLHFRNSKNYAMPIWIHKYICCYLAWLLRMKRPGYDLTWRSIRHQWSSSLVHSDNITNHLDIHYSQRNSFSISHKIACLNKQAFMYSIDQDKRQLDAISKMTAAPLSTLRRVHSDQNSKRDHDANEASTIRSELRTIISQLALLTNHIWKQERHEKESQDWKFVAMVIDRLCLILFSLAMIIFTSCLFIFACDFYLTG